MERHGPAAEWSKYMNTLKDLNYPDEKAARSNWVLSKVMVVQIFTGNAAGGHWSLVVVDRSSFKPGIFVYFDSLSGSGGSLDRANEVKKVIAIFPFYNENSKWIRARVLDQRSGSNDCGVFMTCLATAFVKSLDRDNVVGGSNQSLLLPPYTSVTVELNGGAGAFGVEGRKHILQSMNEREINLDSAVFDMLNITRSYDV